MKIYLVGGWVRDTLLGLEPKDADYVVVGATPQEMIDKGFKQVGKDFPVFLAADGTEFALARRERKIGPGYYGFETEFDTSVTLEDDLRRRDITINAVAYDPTTGVFIDPFNGREDLDKGVLRHVSEAFVEDPVRILRVCRFAARYSFMIAPKTTSLMIEMVERGEVDHLVPERVCAELLKVLAEKWPLLFFHHMQVCGASAKLFPCLQLTKIPDQVQQEIKLGVQVLLTPLEQFAVLTRETSLTDIHEICETYRLPQEFQQFALAYRYVVHEVKTMTTLFAATLMMLFEGIDAFRKKEILGKITCVIQKVSSDPDILHKLSMLKACYNTALQVNMSTLSHLGETLKGPQIGQAIRRERIRVIEQLLNQ
jgi:tRNA nucleotidyltransferase (CCA-adding enzyme)